MKDNSIVILNYAKYLNAISSVDVVGKYYLEQATLGVNDRYNLLVTLLGMCVNKELSIIISESEDVSVEKFPDLLKKVYDEILRKYIKYNKVVTQDLRIKSVDDEYLFEEYIDNMVRTLLSGFKYIEKRSDEPWHQCYEHNEFNTQYKREERIRDCMKNLIAANKKYTKFTMEHGIELPYMYVLAWDLPNLLMNYEEPSLLTDVNDTSYIWNLPRNTSISLRHISDDMMNILLNGFQVDSTKLDFDEKIGFRICERVNFQDLLPTINFVDKSADFNDLDDRSSWVQARKNHRLPFIKKEILKKVPLIPKEMEKSEKDKRLMKMMIDLLKAKNETKDFLTSDIVYLKIVIVDICKLILGWILDNNELMLRIEKKTAEKYLHSIIDAVENMPRKSTMKNHKDHLVKVTTVIAKKWDNELLKTVNIDVSSETYILYSYFSVLKLARNWNEHNLIKNPSVVFVVFLFMIAIRYSVCIDKLNEKDHKEYLDKESKLFKFFKKEKIHYDEKDIKGILEAEYLEMYQYVRENAFRSGNLEKWAKNFPRNNKIKDPHQVLNTAGYIKSLIKNKMSEYEIYLSFWLSMHFGNDQSSFKNVIESEDVNLMEIVQFTYNYQKESFLVSGMQN